MNIMTAKELNKRLEGTGVVSLACQPGEFLWLVEVEVENFALPHKSFAEPGAAFTHVQLNTCVLSIVNCICSAWCWTATLQSQCAAAPCGAACIIPSSALSLSFSLPSSIRS